MPPVVVAGTFTSPVEVSASKILSDNNVPSTSPVLVVIYKDCASHEFSSISPVLESKFIFPPTITLNH